MEPNTHSQCDSRMFLNVTSRLEMHSKNQWITNLTRKITHTHTKCWYAVRYLESKFFVFNLLNYKIQQTSSHWTQDSLVHSINSHNMNERFSFKESYAYLNSGNTQSVWNSGYSKNFYKEQIITSLWHYWCYTHTHTPVLGAWGEISAVAEILDCPNVRTLSCLKIQHRNMREVISFPPMSLEGRYTTTFRSTNK
jgi:hypothetical protein